MKTPKATSQSNVTYIQDASDYVEIPVANGDIHRIPVAVFRYVISGNLTVNRISEFIPIYQEITRQWFQLKGLK